MMNALLWAASGRMEFYAAVVRAWDVAARMGPVPPQPRQAAMQLAVPGTVREQIARVRPVHCKVTNGKTYYSLSVFAQCGGSG